MKILYINHYAGSPKHGMEFRPFYLASEWVRMGHEVNILAASFSHVRNIQPAMNRNSLNEESIDGVYYRWYRTPIYRGNGLGRAMNMLSFVRKLWWDTRSIAKRYAPDMVVASSTYPMDIWPAFRIAKSAAAKLVFELHDLWPLTPVELNGMSRLHPFVQLCQLSEDFACRRADAVISMLPKASTYLESRGMAPEKFTYVSNGVALDDWTGNDEELPDELSTTIEVARSKGNIIVGYTGFHGTANALNHLIDAAKLLHNESVHFILIGDGPLKQSLMAAVKEYCLEKISFFDPVPKKQIPSVLKLMDIAFLGWKKQPLYRFGISPNKLMDYMMAELPVVHSVSAGNDPVDDAKCGITVAPESPEAIANAIKQLAKLSSAERRLMGTRGKEFVMANHTYPLLASRFLGAVFKNEDSTLE